MDRRSFFTFVGAVAVTGTAGCSALTGSASPSLRVLIFNAADEVITLKYSINNAESTIASASIQVAPTPDGNHYTMQTYREALRDGDKLEIEVVLPDNERRATADLTFECDDDCDSRFTIRISQGMGVSVYGGN